MADELEANVALTYELIRDDGLRFTRQGWRMYQHIFNRTLRTYLETASDRPWERKAFRDTMLAATRRIRNGVKDEVGTDRVSKPVFKRIAIEVMAGERDAFLAAQERRTEGRTTDGPPLLGPVCTDYLATQDDPPPE